MQLSLNFPNNIPVPTVEDSLQIGLTLSSKSLVPGDWFNLLSIEEDSHLYRIQVVSRMIINNTIHEPGFYYARISKDEMQNIDKRMIKIYKLSFSEIVHLSDIYAYPLTSDLGGNEELEKLVEAGEVSRYLDKDFASTDGLKRMRDKVNKKYFSKGIRGLFNSLFSLIGNFFRKYNLFLNTGIYWPGNTTTYVDKVLGKINNVKREIIEKALPLNQEVLAEELGIPLEKIQSMSIRQIKVIYRKEAFKRHSDKGGDKELFRALNKVFSDYEHMVNFIESLPKGKTKVKKETPLSFHANRMLPIGNE